jgi:hypothetical protein
LLFTETNARPLPKIALPDTKAIPASYHDELLQMRGVLKGKNAFIFFFHRVGRSYLVSEPQLTADLHLNRLYKGQDGTVYTLRFARRAQIVSPSTATTATTTATTTAAY